MKKILLIVFFVFPALILANNTSLDMYGIYQRVTPGAEMASYSAYGAGAEFNYFLTQELSASTVFDYTFANVGDDTEKLKTLWLGLGPKISVSYIYARALFGLVRQSYSGLSSSSFFYGGGAGVLLPLTGNIVFNIGMNLKFYKMAIDATQNVRIRNIDFIGGIILRF